MADTELDGYANVILDILYAPETEPDWLIPGLLLQGGVVCLAGQPAAGKSYVSYTIGLAVASGAPALSGIIPAGEPRTVVYFDQENGKQDRDAYIRRAWHGLGHINGRKPDSKMLDKYFHPIHFKLGVTDGWEETVETYIVALQPRLVVFDTATSCFAPANENDNSEANREIQAIRRLITLTSPECTAVVLRHAATIKEGEKRRMRGAQGWQSFTDGVLFQTKTAGRPRNDGLNKTYIDSDKTRAFGLESGKRIEISPRWTDDLKTGLALYGKLVTTERFKPKKGGKHSDSGDDE